MPRYFFHRTCGVRQEDDDGVDLPNHAAARREAIIYAGETLKFEPQCVCQGHDLRIEVSDENGLTLFVATVSLADATFVAKTAA